MNYLEQGAKRGGLKEGLHHICGTTTSSLFCSPITQSKAKLCPTASLTFEGHLKGVSSSVQFIYLFLAFRDGVLICSSGWLWTCDYLPASASQVYGFPDWEKLPCLITVLSEHIFPSEDSSDGAVYIKSFHLHSHPVPPMLQIGNQHTERQNDWLKSTTQWINISGETCTLDLLEFWFNLLDCSHKKETKC